MRGVLRNVNRIVGVILCSLLSMGVVSLLQLIYLFILFKPTHALFLIHIHI